MDSSGSTVSKSSDQARKRSDGLFGRKICDGREHARSGDAEKYARGGSQIKTGKDGGEITSGQIGKRCTVSISEAAGEKPVSVDEPDDTQVRNGFVQNVWHK